MVLGVIALTGAPALTRSEVLDLADALRDTGRAASIVDPVELTSPLERAVMSVDAADRAPQKLIEAAAKGDPVAVYGLVLLGGERVRYALRRARLQERDPALYAKYLASTGTPEDLRWLMAALLDPREDAARRRVRREAAMALLVLKPERALPRLLKAMESADSDNERRTLLKRVAEGITQRDQAFAEVPPRDLRGQLIQSLLRNGALLEEARVVPSPRVWVDKAGGVLWFHDDGRIRWEALDENSVSRLASKLTGANGYWSANDLTAADFGYVVSADGKRALVRMSAVIRGVSGGATYVIPEGREIAVVLSKVGCEWKVSEWVQ